MNIYLILKKITPANLAASFTRLRLKLLEAEYFNLTLFLPVFIILGFVLCGLWQGNFEKANYAIQNPDELVKAANLLQIFTPRYLGLTCFCCLILCLAALISSRYVLGYIICVAIGFGGWFLAHHFTSANFLVKQYHNDVRLEARVIDIIPRANHLSIIAGDIKIIKDSSYEEAPNYRDDAHKDLAYTKTLPWYRYKKVKTDAKTPVSESLAGLKKIMLSYYTNDKQKIQINDRIVFDGKIFSLPKRLYFSDYNYEQMLVYQGFNAMGQVKELISSTPDQDKINKILTLLTKIRYKITSDIKATIEDSDTASIIDALITGKRTSLTKELNTAISRSGLSHILSISGMHIAIVASFFILAFEIFAVLCAPNFVLRQNIKKVSAITGIAGSFCYLAISGFLVPAARSFLMIALMLIAVMLGRRALTLRSLALIAACIILFVPYSVFYASFQLSFIAVLSLIITFGSGVKKQFGSRVAAIGYYFWAIIVSSVITSVVTMFFVIYHFGVVSISAVLANMIAIPLFTFFIMPLCVFYAICFFAGFGFLGFLQSFFLHLIAFFVKVLIWTAKVFSSSKLFFVAMIGPSSFNLYTFYIAFICFGFFATRGIKALCICICGLCLLYYAFFEASKKPALVTDGSNVIFYDPDYKTYLQNGAIKDEFLKSVWLQELALYDADPVARQNIYLSYLVKTGSAGLVFISSLYDKNLKLDPVCLAAKNDNIVIFARWIEAGEIASLLAECKKRYALSDADFEGLQKRIISNIDFYKRGTHSFFIGQNSKGSNNINIITTYKYGDTV